MGKELRLDKYLADMKVGTRSEVKIYIRKCRVSVNGAVIRDVGYKVEENDTVTFDGKPVGYAKMEYYMLNKPAGVLTATLDKHQPTVLDILSDAKRRDLFPVGRLDKDTEGLLLITNDGKLAHELLSPKKHVDKVYYAVIDAPVTKEDVKRFAEGLQVDEEFTAMPAELEILRSAETSEIKLTIREGKFHQVKRMFEAVGKNVTYLKRLSMGTLVLDKALAPGEYRAVTDEELDALKRLCDSAGKNNAYAEAEKEIETEVPERTAEITCTGKFEQLLAGKKAVLFDLDGTLVDSMWMWKQIDIEYLGQFGVELPEKLQSEIAGMSFSETAQYFQRTFPQITHTIDEMKACWNQMALDKYRYEVPLKPGVAEFLQELKRRGIKTGIATSNSCELVTEVLQSLGVRSSFDAVHTACEVAAGKPAPDIYLYVAEKLGVPPEECLVFEDIVMGIRAGKSAGMQVCAVQDEFSMYEEAEKKQEADYFIESYLELVHVADVQESVEL